MFDRRWVKYALALGEFAKTVGCSLVAKSVLPAAPFQVELLAPDRSAFQRYVAH